MARGLSTGGGSGRCRPCRWCRGAASAERLLADDCAGRLVVDVEVSGGEPQSLQGLLDRVPITAPDGPGMQGDVPSTRSVVPSRRRRRRTPRRSDRRSPPASAGASGRRPGRGSAARTSRGSRRTSRRRGTLRSCCRYWYCSCLRKALSSITAPMKVDQSRTSPTFISPTMAVTRSETSPQRLRGT